MHSLELCQDVTLLVSEKGDKVLIQVLQESGQRLDSKFMSTLQKYSQKKMLNSRSTIAGVVDPEKVDLLVVELTEIGVSLIKETV